MFSSHSVSVCNTENNMYKTGICIIFELYPVIRVARHIFLDKYWHRTYTV